jgi:DNA-binding Lrp family transcriptional regulator
LPFKFEKPLINGHLRCYGSVRINGLEDRELKGYSVILDPVKLGYDLTAIIFVQTEVGTSRI